MEFLTAHWIEILVALLILSLVPIIWMRGLKGSAPGGWSIDVPGPQTQVLRERNGSRVFVEFSKAASLAEKLAEVRVEIRALPHSSLARAMDYTQTKVDSFLYDVDEAVIRELDLGTCDGQAWSDAIGPITGNLRRRLMEEILRPSFVNNGFYEFRTIGPGGEIGNTRDWIDYLEERKYTIGAFVRHYLRNKFQNRKALEPVSKSLESGPLKARLDGLVEDLYDRFWTLHHQQKQNITKLNKDWFTLLDRLKEEP